MFDGLSMHLQWCSMDSQRMMNDFATDFQWIFARRSMGYQWFSIDVQWICEWSLMNYSKDFYGLSTHFRLGFNPFPVYPRVAFDGLSVDVLQMLVAFPIAARWIFDGWWNGLHGCSDRCSMGFCLVPHWFLMDLQQIINGFPIDVDWLFDCLLWPLIGFR